MKAYDWELVTVDEEGDVLDIDGQVDPVAAIAANPEILTGTGPIRLRLIVAYGDEFSSEGRDEATVENGRLPEFFDESGPKIPAKFHKILKKIS